MAPHKSYAFYCIKWCCIKLKSILRIKPIILETPNTKHIFNFHSAFVLLYVLGRHQAHEIGAHALGANENWKRYEVNK